MRARLGVGQAVFSQLVGVSVELFQSREQARSTPRPFAARLLAEVFRNPTEFLQRLMIQSPPRTAVQELPPPRLPRSEHFRRSVRIGAYVRSAVSCVKSMASVATAPREPSDRLLPKPLHCLNSCVNPMAHCR